MSKLRSSLSLFKVGLVERSRAYRSFRLKFLSVRPSWTKIKPSEIWRKCNQRRREPANLYLPMPKRWTTCKATPKIDRTWMETEVFTAAAKRNNREKARGSKYRKSRKSEQTALETVTLLKLEKRRITQVVHWNWKREASVVYIDRPQWKLCRYSTSATDRLERQIIST